jgi:hypothetical protein
MAIQVERPWEFMAKGLDFGHGVWRLHTLLGQGLQFLYFIGYLQPVSLDSTKFAHPIPQSLDLDNHSVKRP